ncbi:MAG: hypothetical protein QGG50_08040 [Methanopyri archaeon]|jgi:hypothetical protein|nr:hypothetical protein [Methanopyri archaeon]
MFHAAALLVATLFCLPLLMLYSRYFDQAMIVMDKLRRGESLDEGEGAFIANPEDKVIGRKHSLGPSKLTKQLIKDAEKDSGHLKDGDESTTHEP